MSTQNTATHRTPTPAELRSRLHGMWAAVAPAWGEHAAYLEARGETLGGRMLDLAELRPGDRVLELACGAGALGIAAAERVAPGGEVVLSDVAPAMIEIAATCTKAQGLRNVGTRVLDLEAIDEPDESYDAVLCREGLMFALDPAHASAEINRVLRPGGRFVAAVWGPRERNPWLAIVLDAASAQLGRPVPPPGVPGPFALSDRDRLAEALTGGGFNGVSIEELPVPTQAASTDEWWERTCALAGPLTTILATLDDEERRELRRRALDSAAPYESADGLDFPGLTFIAVARCGDT